MLNYLRNSESWTAFSLESLSKKLAMLLLLLSGQRCQTIAQLSSRVLFSWGHSCYLDVLGNLKTSRPGCLAGRIMLKAYPDDISLCVVNALKVYSDRTRQFRPEGNKGPLLLSFVAPHKPIGPSTVSRWSLDVMKKAGINVSVSKAHSTHTLRLPAQVKGPSLLMLFSQAQVGRLPGLLRSSMTSPLMSPLHWVQPY